MYNKAVELSCVNNHLEISKWILLLDHIVINYEFTKKLFFLSPELIKFLYENNRININDLRVDDDVFFKYVLYKYEEISKWLLFDIGYIKIKKHFKKYKKRINCIIQKKFEDDKIERKKNFTYGFLFGEMTSLFFNRLSFWNFVNIYENFL